MYLLHRVILKIELICRKCLELHLVCTCWLFLLLCLTWHPVTAVQVDMPYVFVCLLPCPQALLSAHDTVAQKDFEPLLPPLPDDIPESEEAMRSVCLVKNQQPLVRTLFYIFL